jgi:LysM repeat protein
MRGQGMSETRTQISEITVHKVKTGETLEGLAKANGLTRQMLAHFNWGTSKPDEINTRLRFSVGCTKKTKDRKNYVFDDSDNPGLIYIPKPVRLENLSTKKTHILRVRKLPVESKIFIFSA